ncbi:hypothetical protein LLG07_01170 [bacterium]|nr:hypothetical protein [bacterium]
MTDQIKNIFKHSGHTGAGINITMADYFLEKNKIEAGGVFYFNGKKWTCCGDMICFRPNTITFRGWADDQTTKSIQEGMKKGDDFALIVYGNGQFYELIPIEVRTLFALQVFSETKHLVFRGGFDAMVFYDVKLFNTKIIRLPD